MASNKRLTIKNPNGSYRLIMSSMDIRLEGDPLTMFGDIADRLGAYEDIGTPEEIRDIVGTNVATYKDKLKRKGV